MPAPAWTRQRRKSFRLLPASLLGGRLASPGSRRPQPGSRPGSGGSTTTATPAPTAAPECRPRGPGGREQHRRKGTGVDGRQPHGLPIPSHHTLRAGLLGPWRQEAGPRAGLLSNRLHPGCDRATLSARRLLSASDGASRSRGHRCCRRLVTGIPVLVSWPGQSEHGCGATPR